MIGKLEYMFLIFTAEVAEENIGVRHLKSLKYLAIIQSNFWVFRHKRNIVDSYQFIRQL